MHISIHCDNDVYIGIMTNHPSDLVTRSFFGF